MFIPFLITFLPLLSYCKVPTDAPNIILIIADDLGWGDVNPNNPAVSYTPNIAKLASQGIRYTDYHSAASICTPSRAGLLTGRLGQRTGVISNFGLFSKGGLPLTEHTMANYLKSVGYKTGIIGKWHLGHTHDFHPLSRGFDYYFGLPYSNDMGCLGRDAYNIKVNPLCGSNKLFNISLPLYENRTIIEQPPDLRNLARKYAERAQAFMTTAIEDGQPFFLYLPMTHVHVPLASFTEPSGDPFVDAVTEMDWLVGTITKFLEPIAKNSIVMFTSDNGPWEYKCDLAGTSKPYLGKWQKEEGGGGSSSKMTTWEGGHRVPFIVSWPGTLPSGVVSNELVSAYDILPSLALITNFTLPTDRVFDGIPLPFLQPRNYTRTVFLPDVDLLELWALRHANYKVFYATYPDHDCKDNFGKGFLYHNPALVFDVDTDDHESTPLKESELPEGFYHEIELLKKEKRDSIYTNFRSSVNWDTDKMVAPCCDRANPYCCCNIDCR